MHEVVDLLFFLNQVTSADNAIGVWQSLKELAATTGFNQQLVVTAPADGDDQAPTILHPRLDTRTQDVARLNANAAVLLQALAGVEAPMTFADAGLHDALAQRGQSHLETPFGHLGGEGLIVPVDSQDGRRTIFLFMGADPDKTWVARSVLHIASITALRHALQLENRPPVSTSKALSAREIECLNWLTRGKTDEEIGEILSISGRTVRLHVDNAKDKLGVVTRLQAVAKFVRRPTEAS